MENDPRGAGDGLRPFRGAKPPHPFALAEAHFPGRRVIQGAPTAGGTVVAVQRVVAGAPPVPSRLAALRGGEARALEWPEALDVTSVTPAPGRERVLVCTGGMSGDLYELDLDSGARRVVLQRAGWSCGFVDAEHLAVLAEGSVRVYRYAEGDLAEPVATARAPEVNNVFVAHGRVFGKTNDYQTNTFRVLRWSGDALEELGLHAVKPRLYTLHAAEARKGAALVGGVDPKGAPHWFSVAV